MSSRARRCVSLVFGLLVLTLIAPATNAAAATGSVRAVILTPSTAVNIGDAVTATVHVFQSGIHVDPTILSVGISGSRSLTPTHSATGVYDLAFTVQAADVRQDCGITGVCLVVNATVGSFYDLETDILTLASYAVTITPSVLHVSAGQAVNVTAVVTNNGTAQDPDSFTLYSYLFSPAGPDAQQALVATHTAAGTYTASVVVPSSFGGTGILYLGGNAAFAGISVFGQASVGVGDPTGIWVWSRPVSMGASAATVDLYVTNRTGWPAAGAAVSGTVTYYAPSEMTGTFTSTTNASGIARVSLSYPGAQNGARFRGTVTVGGVVQGFYGYVDPPSPDLVAVLDPTATVFAPGSAASVGATFYTNGAPLAGQTLYYVVYTSGAVIASGQTGTDAGGRATVSFLMPAATTLVAYAASLGGTWYSSVVGIYSTPLAATHDTVHAGGLLQVSVPSVPSAVRSVSMSFQGVPSGVNYDPSWNLASGAYGSGEIQFPTGTSLQTSLQLPRTLPKGRDYYLGLWGEPTVYGGSYYHYADVIRIDNVAPVAAATASSATVAPGAAVTVNASGSSDPDGFVVAYRYVWGDGATLNWTSNASATHAFGSPGDYTVTVSVRDDNGAESSTTLTIHVQAAGPGDPLLFVGIGVGILAVAGLAFLLWRRSRRPPTAAPPPEGMGPAPSVSEGPPIRPPPEQPPGPPPG